MPMPYMLYHTCSLTSDSMKTNVVVGTTIHLHILHLTLYQTSCDKFEVYDQDLMAQSLGPQSLDGAVGRAAIC